MKKLFVFLLLQLLFNATIFAQKDSLAKKQEVQVRQYWFVLLLKGPDRTQDSATAAGIQAGHMANINRLYKAGKLKVAGPFGDDGNWRGILIFDCPTIEEVDQLLITDPAIKAGRLSYLVQPWWTAPTGSFTPGKPPADN